MNKLLLALLCVLVAPRLEYGVPCHDQYMGTGVVDAASAPKCHSVPRLWTH